MLSRRQMFEEPDLCQQLGECGFNVSRQILAKDEDGNISSPYAKVTGNDGSEMLVFLDASGRLPLDKNESPMILTQGPADQSIQSLLNQDVIGVGHVCQDSACVKLGEQTHNLERGEKGQLEGPLSLTQSYPVVRLSNLRENPSRVAQSAKAASYRLKTQSLTNAQAELQTLGSNLDKLDKEYKTFLSHQKSGADQLLKSINQLEHIKSQYDKMQESGQALSPANQQKYSLVLQTLRSRNKLLNELALLDQKLAQLNSKVADDVDNVRSLNNFLTAEFKDLTKAA